MATKIKVKLILELRASLMSRNAIAQLRGMSRNSVTSVFRIADQMGIAYSDVKDKSPDEVYKLFFPDKHAVESLYQAPDYEYVHSELKKVGVTLKLLWKEYLDTCSAVVTMPMGYTKYCRGYQDHTVSNKLTNHLEHRPGVKAEVDWSGPTMSYTDMQTGEVITAYLFVGTLPYSQYSYVEPCLDMKQNTWLRCHVHMYEYFNGVPIRTVCDNLKTAVIKHPKEGDIILNDEYEALAQHYVTAVMPTGVRKPKQKSSVEGTVGKIATAIIARLRNRRFASFNELKLGVSDALDDFNKAPFQIREGSRFEIFDGEERQYLHSLPEIPYEIADWFYQRSIGLDSHIVLAKNRYSCPHQYMGKKVDVRVSENFVEIYYMDQRITTHKKFPGYLTNRYSTHEEDMPDHFNKPEWDDTRIVHWAYSIGKHTGEVIERIFSNVKIKEQGYNPSLSVLRLSKTYSEARLETACELALTKVNVPRYHHLKTILASNQDQVFLGNKQKQSTPTRDGEGYVRGPEYYGGKIR
ncbi:IS21 family transposase [Youngiibacter multivorans]|uniref:Transposase n=1 Tax=Youngiibacter multivorans TaxID=937251 RepID=A0ABS4G6J3_9CLOT|nr:IS21 family transposase [Youngiibacter multivorans]MBP1920200.1 transposase [Youngiibacter multivorans]